MSTATPQSFGRYRVIKPIGEGAMGSVYLARDDMLDRSVAIKSIRVMQIPEAASTVMRARFDNEARALSALRHPHVVQVFDMGMEGDTPYLVMEVAPGASLRDRMEDKRFLDAAEAAAVTWQIASALKAAHDQGIVHRDVKPANILEAERGVWKLADFGVARIPGSSLTLAGQFLGTPAYAAPEAVQLGEMSAATDVYGLGATLYAVLVGEPPYGPRGLMTPGALAKKDPPASLLERRPDLPPQLAQAIMSAVAREPDRRPGAADLMAVASALLPPPSGSTLIPGAVLSPVADSDQARIRRRRRLVGFGAAFCAVLGLGILIGSSDDGPGAPGARPAPYGAPGSGASSGMSGGSPGGAEDSSRSAMARRARYQKLWSKAVEKLDKGDYGEAKEKLEEILREFPEDREARRLLQELGAYEAQGWPDD